MRARAVIRAGFAVVVSAQIVHAQEPEGQVVEVTVEGQTDDADGTADVVGNPARPTTAEALALDPGIWVVRRGSAGGEPVIRGQGFERVATQVGPLPLYGACPGRMDPPANYLRPTLASELFTDGFATVHVRGGVMLVPHVRVEAGVENLLDTTYHEHLTRETALAVGDLAAGDEVPAPGRFFHLLVRAEL